MTEDLNRFGSALPDQSTWVAYCQGCDSIISAGGVYPDEQGRKNHEDSAAIHYAAIHPGQPVAVLIGYVMRSEQLETLEKLNHVRYGLTKP